MKHRSLSRQISLYFLIVIILSLTSVGLFSYIQSSRALDKEVERYITQMIDTASYQTDLYLNNYERVSYSILVNKDVKLFLDMNPQDNYLFYELSDNIIKYALRPAFILKSDMHLVYIMGNHGKTIVFDNQTAAFTGKMNQTNVMQLLQEKTPDNGSAVFMNMSVEGNKDSITLARKIRGFSSFEPNGVMAIEVKVKDLETIWNYVGSNLDGFFFIVDEAGNLVFHPDEDQIGTSISNELKNEIFKSDDSTVFEQINGQKHMLVSKKSDYSGWRLVLSIPVDELRKPVSTIRTTTVVVGLITLLCALWLAVRFGQSIVKPIQELKEGMRQTEKGNWSYIQSESRDDELGGLIRSYNLMVTRLKEMIEKVYAAELNNQKVALELQDIQLERHRAEFQALQLQINPHFLYNTLETINCYAIVQESAEISEMVEAMAFMLRYSIQTRLEEITVANELNHVRNYLIILQHRIEREFEIDVLIPPSLLLEKMVRLTLQPIVENAFQHAFPEGIDKHHYIRIDAKVEGDLFYVTVEDNGIGMSQMKLQALIERLRQNRLAEESSDSMYHRGGIGLMNVHRRIQMVFGEQYGLSVESTEHEGTRITMIMPKGGPTPFI